MEHTGKVREKQWFHSSSFETEKWENVEKIQVNFLVLKHYSCCHLQQPASNEEVYNIIVI